MQIVWGLLGSDRWASSWQWPNLWFHHCLWRASPPSPSEATMSFFKVPPCPPPSLTPSLSLAHQQANASFAAERSCIEIPPKLPSSYELVPECSIVVVHLPTWCTIPVLLCRCGDQGGDRPLPVASEPPPGRLAGARRLCVRRLWTPAGECDVRHLPGDADMQSDSAITADDAVSLILHDPWSQFPRTCSRNVELRSIPEVCCVFSWWSVHGVLARRCYRQA